MDKYTDEAIALLQRLIATPSTSRDEKNAADIMQGYIESLGMKTWREANNVWTVSPWFDENKPTLLLNAHIDTVKPVSSWTRKPFEPTIEDGTLYGLGSNDCGGGLVSLLQTMRILCRQEQKYNIVYLASAEEEVSGKDGISRAIPLLPHIDVAIVGEPTGMQPAVAEKGLMVLDLTAHGKSGHAARGEGINALYAALDDLVWIRDYRFERVSPLLGPTIMNATVINAGTQHNVVPDECHIIVDVRTNELYTNEEVCEFVAKNIHSDCKARSYRLHSSHIPTNHPIVQRLTDMGKTPFGSPTLSDQALMSWQSLKLGPGDSARSHSADEFIRIEEINDAIDTYVDLLDKQVI